MSNTSQPIAAHRKLECTAQVKEWMHRQSGVPMEALEAHMFLLRDRDATQHLMEVAGGLDSLIKGEGQILAQVRSNSEAFPVTTRRPNAAAT